MIRRRPLDLETIAVIALGGALGALARYELALAVHIDKDTFPWATFWTNVSGAFVIGVFLTAHANRLSHARLTRAFFAIGVLGAYTTFSTLAVDTVLLVKDHCAGRAALYFFGSIVTGVLVAAIGTRIGHALAPKAAE